MNKSFYIFNQSSSTENKLEQLENKVNNMQLMYRKPGTSEYQNITQVLDEIYNKLQDMECRFLDIESLIYDDGSK